MISRRAIAVTLSLSVALNVFALGAVASWAWQRRDPYGHHRPPAGLERREEAPRQHAFGWLSEPERAELRSRRKVLRQLRREAEDVLRADNLDAEKLRASLAALRRETDAVQSTVHEHLLRRASELGPNERRRLAEVHWPGDLRRRSGRIPRHDPPPCD